jgi:hypothetical protein
MALIPARFLIRVCHPCKYVKKMPLKNRDALIDLPESCRIDNLAGIDGTKNFADVRIAWNEHGVGFQAQVRGKEQLLQCDAAKPKLSDGVTLWIDTRDSRAGHRASRTCHQFHFLPTGGGTDKDEPAFVPSKIHRALQDASLAPASAVPFRCEMTKGGYRVEAFLSSAALTGFDPEEHPRLGLFYAVRDSELGEQTLSIGHEFPYGEDPSLWEVLELTKN